MPSTISTQLNTVRSSVIIPMVLELRCLRFFAIIFGTYPISFAVLRMRSFVSSPTLPLPFRILETVAIETPHSFATSLIVAITIYSSPVKYFRDKHLVKLLTKLLPNSKYNTKTPLNSTGKTLYLFIHKTA